MSRSVQITRSSSLSVGTGQSEGMIRKGAIVNQSDQVCASLMIAYPHTTSAIHHHGPQDTIVYALSGHGILVSEGGKAKQELHPGDFALVPAWCEHQEANEGDEEVVWVITRGGKEPVVVNLEGWGEGKKEG